MDITMIPNAEHATDSSPGPVYDRESKRQNYPKEVYILHRHLG
jgi:hypothetical protein